MNIANNNEFRIARGQPPVPSAARREARRLAVVARIMAKGRGYGAADLQLAAQNSIVASIIADAEDRVRPEFV